MKIKKGQILEIEVTDIAFGGRGFARVDGLAVFIDQAVAGDRVAARIIKKKKSHAEARVMELIRPSPMRIPPPCHYSGFCGGCKWQFLRYDHQIDFKRRHVIDCLSHIGMLPEVPVHRTLPSKKLFGYRNKMEFSFSDRRWLLPAEMGNPDLDIGFALGLHVPGTFHKVLDTSACLLQPDVGNRIMSDVRRFAKQSGQPVYGLRSHEGFWRFLMLRHSVAQDKWMVNIITAHEEQDLVRDLASRLMDRHPEIASVVNNITARKAGVAIGEYEIPMAGQTVIQDTIGPYKFDISANSFFQTNTRGAETLYDVVRDYARLQGDETVLDLYSGIGTIAIYLSETAASVTGLEITQSAVADAEENCKRNNISNCRFVLGDIKDSLAAIDNTPDVMVIDPPRAGMHKHVVRKVLDLAPERIVYVSCNPSTLARDLEMMKDIYQVREVQPVDMFPHTFHIESVARLRKR